MLFFSTETKNLLLKMYKEANSTAILSEVSLNDNSSLLNYLGGDNGLPVMSKYVKDLKM